MRGFESGRPAPDFVLDLLTGQEQHVTPIEPHGLTVKGQACERVLFRHQGDRARLNDPEVILNSFILSWTRHAQLNWGPSRADLERKHVLFMTEGRAGYFRKPFRMQG